MKARTPEAAFPGYLPIPDAPWRLIDRHGSFLRGPDGLSLRFPSDKAALAWLEKHNIPLLLP